MGLRGHIVCGQYFKKKPLKQGFYMMYYWECVAVLFAHSTRWLDKEECVQELLDGLKTVRDFQETDSFLGFRFIQQEKLPQDLVYISQEQSW